LEAQRRSLARNLSVCKRLTEAIEVRLPGVGGEARGSERDRRFETVKRQ
jgi:hypothetical protein